MLSRACHHVAALAELFSKPVKGHNFRRYDLKFENGQPVFTLSEVDRMFELITGTMRVACSPSIPRSASMTSVLFPVWQAAIVVRLAIALRAWLSK